LGKLMRRNNSLLIKQILSDLFEQSFSVFLI
jgi:hypothetical protein